MATKQQKIEALLSGDIGRIQAALEQFPKDIPIYHTVQGTGIYYTSDGALASRSAIKNSPSFHATAGKFINAVIIHYAEGSDILSILKNYD